MAWDFDGTDDYMELALPSSYDVPKTLACWFNTDSSTTAQTLISLSSGNVSENLSLALSLRLSSTSTVLATSSAGNGLSNATTSGTYTQNNWHHAAAVFPSTASRTAYLDGIGTTQTATRSAGSALDNLILGQGSGGTYNPGQPFNGRLAEIAVWDVALDESEIVSLAKGYIPTLIRPDKLLWYIPLVREVQDLRSGITISNSATAVSPHPRRIG